MSSGQLFSFFVFTTLVLFLSISPPCSSQQEYFDRPAVFFPTIYQDEKVDLFLYYESLCPGCATFISEYLVKDFENGLIDIVNLRLVPWGNAKVEEPNNTIICQHNEDECYFNTIEACAINAWPDLKTHFDFIDCLESQTSGERIHDKEKMWRSCCQKLKLSEKPIQDCYSSGLGKTLELQYGEETNRLKPPHKYVPWLTMTANQTVIEDLVHYTKYVCEAYKGSHVPKACKKLRPTKTENTAHEKAMSSSSVCYNNEARHLDSDSINAILSHFKTRKAP
ncbi:hypothetical protein ACOSP7_029208 [Xanthoceras sorbifolium]